MLTKEQVIKIAKLVRLKLTEQEITKYQTELSSILDYVEQLNEINTDNIKPLYQVTGLEHVVRNDKKTPQPEIIKNLVEASPQGQDNNQFLVKNVI